MTARYRAGRDRRVWARSIHFAALSSAALAMGCATLAPSPGGHVEAAFDRAKASPPALRAFLQAMPKGGDLHSHLSGAVYAESYLRWGIQVRWSGLPELTRRDVFQGP